MIALLLVGSFVSDVTIDPWKLLNPKKILTLMAALLMIQGTSNLVARWLGEKTGAILTGFFGGLISSTAATAAIAKKNKTLEPLQSNHDLLSFLASTVAMLIEGFTLVLLGITDLHLEIALVFLGPVLATMILIFVLYRKTDARRERVENTPFKVTPIIKLTLLIVAMLGVSKIFQSYFGDSGLLVITFLVSLFEIHGSIIANVQLYESNIITANFLGTLIFISLASSYLSKLFLIWSLGRRPFFYQAAKSSLLILFSLVLGWVFSLNLEAF